MTETVTDGVQVVEVGYAQPASAAQAFVAAAVGVETTRAEAAEAALTTSVATAVANAASALSTALAGLSPAEFPAGAQGSGLTHSGIGQLVGGVTVTTGMRVLDTASAVSAGLWVAAASGAWARPADFATGSSAQGKLVDVSGGGVWLCVSASPVTVDTTSQTWTEIDASVIQAGSGLSKSGTTLSLALTKALVTATGLTYSDVGAIGQGAAGPMYVATQNGLKCDNATDDTAALNALLATARAAGGGTIVLPSMTYCAGQVVLPNNGAEPPLQPPIRITGAYGPDRVGQADPHYTTPGLRLGYAGRTDTGICGTTAGSTSVTDTAAAAGDYGAFLLGPGVPDKALITAVTPGTGYTLSLPALATGSPVTFTVGGGRIQSTGHGSLELDHLMLISGSSYTGQMPFGWSTNTVMNIHDCTFLGSPSNTGPACCEDSWVFGGSVHAFTGAVTLTTAQDFQGYGGVVERNFFDHIRRMLCLSDVSSLWISHNILGWQGSGSNLTNVTTLTSALVSGTPYTSLTVSALSNPVYIGDVIQVGTAGPAGATAVQQVTATAYAPAGATSVTCSFTANAAYATGTLVIDYTTGLGAPFESMADPAQHPNCISLEYNRLEMNNNYTHATILRNSPGSHIISNEIQDTNLGSNVACHYFDSLSGGSVVIVGEVDSQTMPLLDGTAAAYPAVIDPRPGQLSAFPHGISIPGAQSSYSDGISVPLFDTPGNKWFWHAASGQLLLKYVAQSGSPVAGDYFLFAVATGITTFYNSGKGILAVQSTAGSALQLGDTTRTADVAVTNGNLSVTHLLAIGTAPAVASASSSTGLSIAGQDTAHSVALTTAASLSAGAPAATITFGLSYATRAPSKTPRFSVDPKNLASALAQPYVTGDTQAGYSVALANPPPGATAMAFDVTVIGS